MTRRCGPICEAEAAPLPDRGIADPGPGRAGRGSSQAKPCGMAAAGPHGLEPPFRADRSEEREFAVTLWYRPVPSNQRRLRRTEVVLFPVPVAEPTQARKSHRAMNYRHLYHAGNHTEVYKHAALVWLLDWLCRKPTPFMVLDTHAGTGIYDLESPEAERTREADGGVRAILGASLREAEAYQALVRPYVASGSYPGSPAIVASFLREQDRLVACELHPADGQTLRRNFRLHRNVGVHVRNGYEAALALTPPPERRGLVFIDPPFEDRDEAMNVGRTLAAAARKWRTGCYVAWYPFKTPAIGDVVSDCLIENGVPNCLRAEFLRFPEDGVRLAGGGLIVVNPPWRFDEALRDLGDELLGAFEAPGGRSSVRWLAQPG